MKGNLSFEGSGTIKVDVTELVKSESFRQQVEAVRELQNEIATTKGRDTANILEWLRNLSKKDSAVDYADILTEAADEIERLERELTEAKTNRGCGLCGM